MRFAGEGASVAVADRAGIGSARTVDLIDTMLLEQRELTAVERFARTSRDRENRLRDRRYSALLPASPPGPGQQLAFEVDLDRCSGCKACVAACHALNGLDEGETWRDVGLLVGGTSGLPVIQHVTTACHHCVEPGCLAACPADAYEKDPVTGIVRHLDDQCIGCRYCTLACPYEVPKYHEAHGIVRKCDMCTDRLAIGEAPACVQACPHEAIRIRVVDVADVSDRAEAGEFLPGAFVPTYTRPTTRFHSSLVGVLHPADGERPEPDHGHMPLVAMLVFTQLAAGGFLLESFVRGFGRPDGVAGAWFTSLCLAIGLMGLASSLFHLGRPRYAFRALLGLRHSWLSREVLALGLFAKLAVAFVLVDLIAPDQLTTVRDLLLILTAVSGALGVACSVMVYHAVRRPWWYASITGWKFAGTSVVLALSAASACQGMSAVLDPNPSRPPFTSFVIALAIATVAKLGFELRDLRENGWSSPLGRTSWLLRGPLRRDVWRRGVLAMAGGLALPLAAVVLARLGALSLSALAFLVGFSAILAGELFERRLFFVAMSRPRMPGGLPS